MKVYLCGGINGLTDSEANDWRDYAIARINCETLNPMRRDYRGKESEHIEDIVTGDEEDIQQSSVLLVNASRPSWGTAMEIYAAARVYGPTVISIVPPNVPVSPWLAYHSDIIVHSLDEGIGAVNSLVEEYISEQEEDIS